VLLSCFSVFVAIFSFFLQKHCLSAEKSGIIQDINTKAPRQVCQKAGAQSAKGSRFKGARKSMVADHDIDRNTLKRALACFFCICGKSEDKSVQNGTAGSVAYMPVMHGRHCARCFCRDFENIARRYFLHNEEGECRYEKKKKRILSERKTKRNKEKENEKIICYFNERAHDSMLHANDGVRR